MTKFSRQDLKTCGRGLQSQTEMLNAVNEDLRLLATSSKGQGDQSENGAEDDLNVSSIVANLAEGPRLLSQTLIQRLRM